METKLNSNVQKRYYLSLHMTLRSIDTYITFTISHIPSIIKYASYPPSCSKPK